MTDIINKKEGYETFREEIDKAVIVTAIGNNNRHSICIMKSTYEMITTSLASRIRTMWLIFCLFSEECSVKI